MRSILRIFVANVAWLFVTLALTIPTFLEAILRRTCDVQTLWTVKLYQKICLPIIDWAYRNDLEPRKEPPR
jgi:hypothetical protein